MREILEQFTLWSAIDILIIAVIVYQGLILLRGTRAAQMLTGILLLVALGMTARILPFTTLHWLLSKLYPSILLILIIIFQDDIRHLLSTMGRRPLITGNDSDGSQQMILDDITRAASALAAKRIGALIVIERDILLSRYVEVGIQLDAKVTKEILMAIFHPSSPVHDGAVIIQKGRIASAGSFLPLTRDENVDPNLGTRHRAALGISQETDAVVVIVSEEGASMAIVEKGRLIRKPDAKTLKDDLMKILFPDSSRVPTRSSSSAFPAGGSLGKMKTFFRSMKGRKPS